MGIKLRTRKLKDSAVTFYLDIYSPGTKRRYEWLDIKVLKSDTTEKKKEKKAIAESIRAQRELEFLSTGTVYTPKHIQKADFLEYCQAFILRYEKKDVRMVKYSVLKFQDYLRSTKKQNLTVGELTLEVCEGFQAYLLSPEAGLNGETPRNYFARFKKVLKAAVKDGLFAISPADSIQFKGAETDRKTLKKQILTIDELRILNVTACGNPEVKRAFLFASYTGLGIAEIQDLKWLNIETDNRIRVNRKKTGSLIHNSLSLSAIQLLGERGGRNSLVFKVHVSDTAINKSIRKWVADAGIDKDITFYCGRHTYAVLMLKNGVNLKVLSDAMGHADTTHTVKYLNYVGDEKDDATSNLPDL